MQIKPFGLAILFALLLAGDAGAQYAGTQPSSLTAAQRAALLSAQTVQPKALPKAVPQSTQAQPSSMTAAQRARLAANALAPTQAAQPQSPPPSGGVDWRLAAAYQKRTAGATQAVASGLDQGAVDRTALPILLPNDAGLMAGARLYSFGDYYTVTANTPGGHVSLSGTTDTVPVSTPLNMSSQGPGGLTIQRTVDGQLASFVRYGVLYSVEVRCNSPADPKCRNDAFVRAVTAKTTLVLMGAAARKAAGMGN